jgi:hypothetical protein
MEMGTQGASSAGSTTAFVCSAWFFRLFLVYFLIIVHANAATASTDDDDEPYVYVNVM